MTKKQLFFVLLLLVAGIIGAALSVAMVIRGIQWREWGRVALYCVTAVISVENAVLVIGRLKSRKSP